MYQLTAVASSFLPSPRNSPSISSSSPGDRIHPARSPSFMVGGTSTAPPSNSTGSSLIAGVEVSISGVCVDTDGLVLWGNVLLRESGDKESVEGAAVEEDGDEEGGMAVVLSGGMEVILRVEWLSRWSIEC
ncbi:hypothetical protein IAQ61_004604 [Plenodomus lingam]|uniref:uncharacterized protein n=1 Tax=Leptosphaeria maculans TaxID=5022 RepID=UPI00332CC37C|nr:hypothetical protein IAQ61_004604 [Plenodomus lingam]